MAFENYTIQQFSQLNYLVSLILVILEMGYHYETRVKSKPSSVVSRKPCHLNPLIGHHKINPTPPKTIIMAL